MVSIWVESDFYSKDSSEINIQNYTMTRFTETGFDFELQFEMPDKITSSLQDPDLLKL